MLLHFSKLNNNNLRMETVMSRPQANHCSWWTGLAKITNQSIKYDVCHKYLIHFKIMCAKLSSHLLQKKDRDCGGSCHGCQSFQSQQQKTRQWTRTSNILYFKLIMNDHMNYECSCFKLIYECSYFQIIYEINQPSILHRYKKISRYLYENNDFYDSNLQLTSYSGLSF